MFILCLALGVVALAGIGSVLAAIEEGLSRTGREMLGGDFEFRLVHRFATDEETAHFRSLGTIARMVDFRGNLSRLDADSGDRALAQVKAVDDLYPLYGAVELDPPLALEAALGPDASGLYGLVAAPELAARLDLAPGDRVRLGRATLEYRAAIRSEPDRVGGGFGFGPRAILHLSALAESGLLTPGSLYYVHYRIAVPAQADIEAIRRETAERFPEAGWRWRDRRAGAPGVERFVARIGSFLSLVGLAALALGGIGAGASMRAYLQRKTAAIAILRTLGATRRTVVAVYLAQVLAIAAIGIAIGLAAGAGLPLLIGPLVVDALPVPAVFELYVAPLAVAALAGFLTATLFAILPLAHACEIPPAALFREEATPTRARLRGTWVAAIAVLGGALLALAFLLSGDPLLAGWSIGFFVLAMALLAIMGEAVSRLSRYLAPRLSTAPRPLRRALSQIGGAGGDARGIAVSIGAAISILVAVAMIEHGLRQAITGLATDDIPAYFVLDVPNEQLDRFLDIAEANGAKRVVSAPMLRGFVTGINGIPASEAPIDPDASWVLRGDRGLSYAAEPPEEARILAGEWWPADYAGPPLVSFSAEEGIELGLAPGSTVTVNVLGRPLTATVANLREVAWQGLGMNFLMVFNPAALSAAPHAHIATLYLDEERAPALLRALAGCCPSSTAVSVRDGIALVRKTLGQIAAAALWGSTVTILTGIAVLAGSAAAGQRRQVYESTVLKALGATRREILLAIALKWAILGLAAALVALGLGCLGAWAMLRFVMDLDFAFSLPVAASTIVAGMGASLGAGLIFAGSSLRASPASLLRSRG